jgi:hypothetical protein
LLLIAGNSIYDLPKEIYTKNKDAEAIVMHLITGNSTAPEIQRPIVNILSKNIREVIRIEGARIPMEHHNLVFTKGTYSTDVPEFGRKLQEFKLKTSEGYNATVFKHEVEDIMEAENNGINLLEQDAKDVQRYSQVYLRRFKPGKLLKALYTGHSDYGKLPTEANGTGTEPYNSSFGFLRGEDNSWVLNPLEAKWSNTSHYRGTADGGYKAKDILDCADLIKAYNTYSGDDIIALASGRTIYELGELYNYAKYKDEHLIEGVTVLNVAGVKFIEISNMSDDFIIFLDSGRRDLILQCVNKAQNQRGLSLITEKDIKAITSPSDTNGMKLRIHPMENLVLAREAGVILSKAQGQTAGVKKGWMTTAEASKLEDLVKRIDKTYENIAG